MPLDFPNSPVVDQIFQNWKWDGSKWLLMPPAQTGGTVTGITAGTGLTASPNPINVSGTIGLTVPVSVANGGTGATDAPTALTNLGAVSINSPVFTGDPRAPTPSTADNDTSIATTAFVKAQNYLTANQLISLSGDVNGSGSTAITTTLANSGVTAGTYQGLTVNAKGIITGATNQSYLTGNQPITLTGDNSGTGSTSISTTTTGLRGRPISATAPTLNQVLAWDGSQWAPNSVAGGASITVADTPPTLTQGALWWNSALAQLYIGYNDGNSIQWVLANNTSGGGSALTIPLAVQYGGSGSTTSQGAPWVDLTGDTMTGPLSITPAIGTSPAINLTRNTVGEQALVQGFVGSSQRWRIILGNNLSESGGNLGSNFIIDRFGDNGIFIDSPLTINRSTGLVIMAAAQTSGSLTVNGNATFNVGAVVTPPLNVGSTSGPPSAAINFGTANTGLYGDATSVSITTGGTNRATFTSTGFTMTGGTLTGQLILQATNPTDNNAATRKLYVDNEVANANANANTRVARAGDTMSGALNINLTGQTLPAHSTAPVLWTTAANGGLSLHLIDAYGSLPYTIYRRANGTAAARTPILSGDALMAIQPYGAQSASAYGGGGQIAWIARENWTTAANGTYLQFNTVIPGTLTSEAPVIMGRGLMVGGTIANDPGPGQIRAAGTINTPTNFWCGGKGSTFGGASGSGATGNVTQADANILLYDLGGSNWAGMGTDTGGNMWFRTNAGSAPRLRIPASSAERASFQSCGLSIGDNNILVPTNYMLTVVNNNGHAAGFANWTTAGASINSYVSQTGTWLVGFGFWNGSSLLTVGSITTNGSATTYGTGSDARLKLDIEPLAGTGEIIDQLQPVQFHWKSSPNEPLSHGFVAQDLYPVYPQAVRPGNDIEPGEDGFHPWMIDHSLLVPLLVAEVKSLRQRLAALEAAP